MPLQEDEPKEEDIPDTFRNVHNCDRCKHGTMTFLRNVDGYEKWKCDNCDAVELREK